MLPAALGSDPLVEGRGDLLSSGLYTKAENGAVRFLTTSC